jgi:hypothetical protein
MIEPENDCHFSEDLCRLYREQEKVKASHLDVCDQILLSPSIDQRHRDWVPASEWTRNLPKDHD